MYLLAGTRKLMGNEYKHFCETMLEAAEEGSLPITLQLKSTFGVTCQDIGDLCFDFEHDTDLKLSAHLFLCDECNSLHAMFEVDYPEEEEDGGTEYLQ